MSYYTRVNPVTGRWTVVRASELDGKFVVITYGTGDRSRGAAEGLAWLLNEFSDLEVPAGWDKEGKT